MTTLARWSKWMVQARGLEPRFSGNRPDVLPLDEAWCWCHAAAYVTLATRLAVGPGFEPGSFRLTAGRVAFATTLQATSWLADVDSNHDLRGQNPLSCR